MQLGIAVIALLFPACVALAGCAAPSDRQAAPDASQDVAAKSSTPSPEGSPVTAINRGVRICFENKSSSNLFVEFTTYTRADEPYTMAPGEEMCGEGTTTFDSDVIAKVEGEGGQRITFEGDNPWIGKPYVSIYTPYSGKWPGYIKLGDLCVSNSGLSEGASRSWDDGRVRGTVLRETDTYYFKEFVVTFQDSANPSADGRAAKCKGGDYP